MGSHSKFARLKASGRRSFVLGPSQIVLRLRGLSRNLTPGEIRSLLRRSNGILTPNRPGHPTAIEQLFFSLVKRSQKSSSSAARREGPSSAPANLDPPQVKGGFSVIDSINHRRLEGHPEPAGVILVLKDCRPDAPTTLIGKGALIETPDRMFLFAEVAAVRDHGPTISVLLGALTKAEVPIGSQVHLLTESGSDQHGPVRSDDARQIFVRRYLRYL